MIEKNGEISIQDNFLEEGEFNDLRANLMGDRFPWFYSPAIIGDYPIILDETELDKMFVREITKAKGDCVRIEDASITPGHLVHVIYVNNVPVDKIPIFPFFSILNQLNYSLLILNILILLHF